MSKFYADEHVRPSLVEGMRREGHVVRTPREYGMMNKGISDERQLRHAASQGLIMLTFDRGDYFDLHMRRIPHHGIVAVSPKVSEADIPKLITEVVNRHRPLDQRYVSLNAEGYAVQLQNRKQARASMQPRVGTRRSARWA